MISKQHLKYLKSLKIKKYRLKAKQVLIEGVRLINESLKGNTAIKEVYCSENFINNSNNKKLVLLLENKKIPLNTVSINILNELSDSVSHQGLIGLANIPSIEDDELGVNNQIILDSISDPGNLGNIIRTLDWFGFQSIYLSEDSTDPYNSKVIRSAMGAHFYMNIVQVDICKHIIGLKNNNFTIIAADLEGDTLYGWSPPEKYAIIFGNEAHGISKKIRKLIDCKITIPKRGNIESLNVSMSAGIVLSHIQNIKGV